MSTIAPFDASQNQINALSAELAAERYQARKVLDIASVMILALDQEGGITLINRRGCEILGCPEDQILGKNWFRHFLPEDVARQVSGNFKQLIAGDATGENLEYAVLTRNNEEKLIAWRSTVLKSDEGEIVGILSSGEDVTERRRVEKTQASLQVKLSNAVEMAHLAHWEYDVFNDMFLFNDHFYRILRTTAEEVGGYTMSAAEYGDRFIHPDDVPKILESMQEALETINPNYAQQLEHRVYFADGSLGYISIRFNISKDVTGRTARIFGVSQDITEFKQVEWERLSNLHFFESMDKVNRAIQGADDLDCMLSEVLDNVLAILDCDRAFLSFPLDPEYPTWTVPMQRARLEYPPVVQIGGVVDLTPEQADLARVVLESPSPVSFGPGADYPLPENTWERFRFRSQLQLAMRPKIGKTWAFGMHQCSHARIWTYEEKKLFQEIGRRLEDGLTSLLISRDLKESEKFLDNLVENIPSAIIVKDAKTLEYVRLNKAGEQLLGRSGAQLRGKTAYDVFPKKEADYITAKEKEAINRKILVNIPVETVNIGGKDDRTLHTRKIPIPGENGTAQYLLGISDDITEQKKLEIQLRQSQKMESIGRLAGGIAHDFNNMLGVILGHTEMTLSQLEPSGVLFGSLQKIHSAAERSADLTRQLLAFARKQTVAPKVLNLNKTVKGMLAMLGRLLGEDLDLAWSPGSGSLLVKMDPSQIDQILVNLCVNARDAIANVGKVTIETQSVSFDEEYCADHLGFSPGDYVLLAVSDNGCGMDNDTLAQIFEPFFTTKQVGKGTGLGLSTVYGIVKQNDGFINVYSELGHGTTFRIYLPQHASRRGTKQENSTVVPARKGHETILLLEDEPSILDIATLMLEKMGYCVFAVSTPNEAIEVAQKHAGKIHLLITDVIMPEMNGRDLANHLVQISPGVKCMFMSGYTNNVIAHHGVLDEGVHYIQKPFSMQDLADKVRETLSMK